MALKESLLCTPFLTYQLKILNLYRPECFSKNILFSCIIRKIFLIFSGFFFFITSGFLKFLRFEEEVKCQLQLDSRAIPFHWCKVIGFINPALGSQPNANDMRRRGKNPPPPRIILETKRSDETGEAVLENSRRDAPDPHLTF